MNGFKFGLEAEFMLASATDFRPLWYKDVTFKELDDVFQSIDLSGLPSLEGLADEPPHSKLMPFIVEGYGIPDGEMKIIDAYPKGVEIRTPVCESLEQVFDVYETIYLRLKTALKKIDKSLIAISHHPLESKFSGPQNKRRHDFWLWAMEVMTTYGPDINVSFPKDISDRLFNDLVDLNRKVNYYAPAMAAISLASPFFEGKPWVIKNHQGKSYRTFKRSVVAPAIELHPDENFRIEFKVFEMTTKSEDFYAYFLLVLSLFLDNELKGRAADQERIYDLGQVSMYGLKAPMMKDRFVELYLRAFEVLPQYGFDPSKLKVLESRIETGLTPGDEMVRSFHAGQTINQIMNALSHLKKLNGEMI